MKACTPTRSRRLRLVAAGLAISLAPSCASIIKGSSEVVEFTSEPEGARVLVTDMEGALVAEALTPCELELDRGAGYFSSRSYGVRFEMDGHAPLDLQLSGSVNAWYILGNLVFGGLVGYIIVDPLTGGMFTLSGDPVHADFLTGEV